MSPKVVVALFVRRRSQLDLILHSHFTQLSSLPRQYSFAINSFEQVSSWKMCSLG
jgi:hypothetical protein